MNGTLTSAMHKLFILICFFISDLFSDFSSFGTIVVIAYVPIMAECGIAVSGLIKLAAG